MGCLAEVECPRCRAPRGEACRKSWWARLLRRRGGVLHDERISYFLRQR